MLPKRILFICHRIPYPPNKGDKIRSYNFIKHLARSHEIHLAFMVDDKKDLSHIKPLEELARSIFWEEISPKLKRTTSTLTALFTGQSISVPYFYSKNLQRKIDSFLDGNTVDLVFCFSSPTAQYLYSSRHANGVLGEVPWFMDLIDMDSHKWRQYVAAKPFLLRWLYMREANYLLAYEQKITKRFDRTLLVSQSEKELLNSYFPADTTDVIGNGVDLHYFAPEQGVKLQSNGPTMVFTGAMDYLPNIEGVKWFVQVVLPQIKGTFPDILFQIVGSNPSVEVRELAKIKGVAVTGFVQDVRDYIRSADVCVVPLRIARGIQNKVLEAMAMGKPVVCSGEAIEGIHAQAGKHLLVANNSTAFAQATVSLLKSREKQQELGGQARRCMVEHYSWESKLIKLDQIVTGR